MADHLKRLTAPNTWPINKKDETFITRPAGSGSPMGFSIPLVVAFKDMLGLATTTKEVKHILHNHEVFVDSTRVHNHDASVGFLGSISIPAKKLFYRLTINTKNTLVLIPITQEEAKVRPVRVEGKTVLKNGIQLNCSGGINVLVKKDEFKTGTTVLVDTAKKAVVESFGLEKGALIFLYKGTHTAHTAVIEEINGKEVMLKADDGSVFETKKNYCFVLGKGKAAFKVA